MDIERCLNRIGYDGPVNVDMETLSALQLAFLYHIPFENLDIHLNRKITLSLDSIYEKLVEQNRGGFCYECNMLFYAMLKELGFEVKYLAASMQTAIALGKDFDHMVLSVSLDQDYLVDVGNGQSCRRPLRIDGGDAEVCYENISYRMGKQDKNYVMESRLSNEPWKPRFLFKLIAREVEEFAGMCHFQQVAPECHFTRHRLATMARPDGRVTLMDKELSITNQQGVEKIVIESQGHYLKVLEDYFHITLAGVPPNWLPD